MKQPSENSENICSNTNNNNKKKQLQVVFWVNSLFCKFRKKIASRSHSKHKRVVLCFLYQFQEHINHMQIKYTNIIISIYLTSDVLKDKVEYWIMTVLDSQIII